MDQQQPQQAPLQQQQEQSPQQAPVPVQQNEQQIEEVSQPPPAYQPPTKMEQPQGQQPHLVPGVIPLENLNGEMPQWIDCPFCQRRTQTRVDKEGSSMQILTGFLCCLVCVCLACVPCMAGWFEEYHYFCSGCNKRVACRADNSIQVFGPQTIVPSKYASRGPDAAGSEANANNTGAQGQTAQQS
ncbi:hypothetical protein B0T20DRAFT_346455 [Sordaria brevicollis]|uniref:LITAF domain-containing protein n=1 Tax=Sordaria brevicollis TaxID=83679 RepID=A0AAE0UFJ4_SORBR|nr:hypothetical protein B0T20DRAFT_346455 [Sordaria brevicollis]